MIEDAQRIFDYLPVSYQNPSDQEYIDFLWDAFSVNYQTGKYQFAYIAYHMIFTSYIYFQLGKIYQNNPEGIKNIMIFTGTALQKIEDHEKKVKESRPPNSPVFNPFDLSKEYESSIVGLFVSIGCDREVIKKMKTLIKARNDIAHSNGAIVFRSATTIDRNIDEILGCVEHIQENINTIIEKIYINFLSGSKNPDNRASIDETDQIQEVFVKGNYLSYRDLQIAIHQDISILSTDPLFANIETLHLKLKEMYPNE